MSLEREGKDEPGEPDTDESNNKRPPDRSHREQEEQPAHESLLAEIGQPGIGVEMGYGADGSANDDGVQEISAVDRDRLLLEHLPTVRYLARRIHERLPQHVELDDLISAGVVGLIDAFSKFDHSKKVQFKSYAQFRIRGAILDSLRTLDWSPRELRRKGRARRGGDPVSHATTRPGTV